MGTSELRRQPVAVRSFFDAVGAASVPTGHGTRKTVTAEAAKSLLADSQINVPDVVKQLLSRFPEGTHGRLLDSVQQGSANYERQHGFAPDASFIEAAIENAVRCATPLKDLMEGNLQGSGIRLDNATSSHHDQLSLQPAMAIVGIMAQFAEAFPNGGYLSADVVSNEARLGILSNLALSDFGDYSAGSSLNGISLGQNYMDSERVCVLSTNGGGGSALTYTVTQKGTATAGGLAVSGSNVAMPLLRGRTALFVNGLPAGRETASYTSGSNTIAGSATIAGTSYALSGTVNSDTGAISITSSPALPAGVHVMALAYIDFEKAPTYTPKIGVDATIYSLFARASRGLVKTSIDAMRQMQLELSLDPRGQALLSTRMQFTASRHFRALDKLMLVGANLTDTWAYGYSSQIQQKSRSDIWMNLAPILAGLSQKMANANSNYGISTLYLTGELAAQARGLPTSIWEPSGIVNRPGIYRLGRLFGQFDCYYTPRNVTESGGGDVSQILCVGRATETARNPIILYDAVPPIFVPLATGDDMQQSDGFYTRGGTEVNPHLPSAQGAAIINVTGIKS